MSGTRAPQSRSTSFLVAIACPHGAVPRRVEIPLEEYQEGERRFVRAHLPGADLDRDIEVTLVGSDLRLRFRRRVENLECESTASHCVTFDKVLEIPAGTTPDDVAAEYGEGVLLISWPAVPSSATAAGLHAVPVVRKEQWTSDSPGRGAGLNQNLAGVRPRPPVRT